ncbi:MAG: hypothetical protein MK161_06190, partial [Pirellulales bacterium]|nr:hypothetical protein [Pirellulales bacterium]
NPPQPHPPHPPPAYDLFVFNPAEKADDTEADDTAAADDLFVDQPAEKADDTEADDAATADDLFADQPAEKADDTEADDTAAADDLFADQPAEEADDTAAANDLFAEPTPTVSDNPEEEASSATDKPSPNASEATKPKEVKATSLDNLDNNASLEGDLFNTPRSVSPANRDLLESGEEGKGEDALVGDTSAKPTSKKKLVRPTSPDLDSLESAVRSHQGLPATPKKQTTKEETPLGDEVESVATMEGDLFEPPQSASPTNQALPKAGGVKKGHEASSNEALEKEHKATDSSASDEPDDSSESAANDEATGHKSAQSDKDPLFDEYGVILGEPGGLASDELRFWVDNTGRFSCRGRMVRMSNGHVRIVKETGKTTTVPFYRLSQADLRFVTRQASAVHEQSLTYTVGM